MDKKIFCISIVSHGQKHLIVDLLRDLEKWRPDSCEIILTFNVPEDLDFLKEFNYKINIILNKEPKGFGCNHNAAFNQSSADIFIVVNPDIRIKSINWALLEETINMKDVGACSPKVVSGVGKVEDNARFFPTFYRLGVRFFLRLKKSDYPIQDKLIEVDWVAGMFILFRRNVYQEIGGFDENYFMYMEDADICRRLWRRKLKVVLQPCTEVIHDAQRASGKSFKHLKWHLFSAVRFLLLGFLKNKSSIY